jgi:hypothetical protein
VLLRERLLLSRPLLLLQVPLALQLQRWKLQGAAR